MRSGGWGGMALTGDNLSTRDCVVHCSLPVSSGVVWDLKPGLSLSRMEPKTTGEPR
jgi:hypothetical protein